MCDLCHFIDCNLRYWMLSSCFSLPDEKHVVQNFLYLIKNDLLQIINPGISLECGGIELLSVKLGHRLILYLRHVCLSDSLLALISQTSVTPLSDCVARLPRGGSGSVLQRGGASHAEGPNPGVPGQAN